MGTLIRGKACIFRHDDNHNKEIKHAGDAGGAGSGIWTFCWTAPILHVAKQYCRSTAANVMTDHELCTTSGHDRHVRQRQEHVFIFEGLTVPRSGPAPSTP